MINLRSDTCSRPTPEMRAAMANADVGDDLYGDDPTVKALDRATAELLGKQNAVYMPTGTMTNQVGMHLVQAVAGEDHREAALTLTAEGAKALQKPRRFGNAPRRRSSALWTGARLPRLLTLLKALSRFFYHTWVFTRIHHH